jgi:hypothetical protein
MRNFFTGLPPEKPDALNRLNDLPDGFGRHINAQGMGIVPAQL